MNRRSGGKQQGPRPASKTRSAITTCIVAQSLGAPLQHVLLSGGVLALLILHLGGTKLDVGMMFTANFLAQIIRIFAAPHIDVSHRKRLLLFWNVLSVIVFSLVFAAIPFYPLLGSRFTIGYILLVFFVHRCLINISVAAWQPLLCDVIPRPLLGRFFGRMRVSFQVVSLTAVLLAGGYLGNDPSSADFFRVLFALFILNAIRPFLLARLPNPPPARAPETRDRLIPNLLRPLRDLPFLHFLQFWAWLAFMASLAKPFIVPFLKLDLAFPSSITVYVSAGLMAGMVLTLIAWGRLADRFGSRFVFLAGVVLLTLSLVVLGLVPAYTEARFCATIIAMLSLILAGAAGAGLGIAHTVRVMHAAPKDHRGPYTALFAMVSGLTAGLGSMLAGVLLDALPAHITIGAVAVPTLRIFFVAVAVLALSSVRLLVRLQRISEGRMRDAFVVVLGEAMSPITVVIPDRLAKRIPYFKPNHPEHG